MYVCVCIWWVFFNVVCSLSPMLICEVLDQNNVGVVEKIRCNHILYWWDFYFRSTTIQCICYHQVVIAIRTIQIWVMMSRLRLHYWKTSSSTEHSLFGWSQFASIYEHEWHMARLHYDIDWLWHYTDRWKHYTNEHRITTSCSAFLSLLDIQFS